MLIIHTVYSASVTFPVIIPPVLHRIVPQSAEWYAVWYWSKTFSTAVFGKWYLMCLIAMDALHVFDFRRPHGRSGDRVR